MPCNVHVARTAFTQRHRLLCKELRDRAGRSVVFRGPRVQLVQADLVHVIVHRLDPQRVGADSKVGVQTDEDLTLSRYTGRSCRQFSPNVKIVIEESQSQGWYVSFYSGLMGGTPTP